MYVQVYSAPILNYVYCLLEAGGAVCFYYVVGPTQRLFKLSRYDKMKIRYFVLQIILQNPSIFLNISVLVPNAPVFKI